jgi:hypothetical protein
MLALLFDIHGNLPALEAVLEDARAAGASRQLLGGAWSGRGWSEGAGRCGPAPPLSARAPGSAPRAPLRPTRAAPRWHAIAGC